MHDPVKQSDKAPQLERATVSRRAILAGVAPAAFGVGAVAVAGAPSAMALPTVWMDRLVVQSQVEPWTNTNTGLPGNEGVKHVQEALRAKVGGVVVDGQFGDQSRQAYAAWQRKLGYSGAGANGIPGPTSLTKLGAGRFEVARMIDTGSRVTYSGVTVNQRTAKMLNAARGLISWNFDVVKGSFVGCDGNSSCTHAWGGAIDMYLDWGSDRGSKTVSALRKVGFAAWLRPRIPGTWETHIHAIAIGDTDMHTEAANQVGDYYKGLNGLSGHAADNLPAQYRVPFTWWEAYQRGSQ